MRSLFFIALFVLLTIACIYYPAKLTSGENTPQQISIGPNAPHYWHSGDVLTLNGTFSIKSTSYFEIKKNDVTQKQAILEKPEVGETDGLYWVRDFPMQGDLTITSGSTIFSLTESTIVSRPQEFDKFFNIFTGCVIGFSCWILGLAFLGWLETKIP